jgi:uncharacterized protein (TIGR00645 family)
MYLGLVFGTVLYLYKFFEELKIIADTLYDSTEVDVMLGILGLIDASMVLNLLVIVIIGGYSIFTSKIDFTGNEDKPQWLDHIDAGRLKIKLASSLASISGVHLLKTFIDIHRQAKAGGGEDLMYEIIIHLVFILSALMLAYVERILAATEKAAAELIEPRGASGIRIDEGGPGI